MRIGRVLEPLDAVGVEPTVDHGGGVHTRIIPVEKTTAGTSSPAFSAANSILHAQQEQTWCQSALIGYGGGHRGDEKRCVYVFLEEMARPMARPLAYHCKELKLWSP
jgi:hypothetical protein